MFGKGKHRAGPENGRLRHELKLAEGRIAWYRGRLLMVGKKNRALETRAEVAEGRLAAADQLIESQAKRLAEREARIGELEEQMGLSCEDTVQTPIPALPEPELAGVA
jgi:chromosome segregation ATPase